MAEQGTGERDGQRTDEDRQGSASCHLGAGHDLCAQHRRPQGHQGADHGQPDPPEQVDQGVGGDEASMPLTSDAEGQDDAEGDADRQHDCRAQVVVEG